MTVRSSRSGRPTQDRATANGRNLMRFLLGRGYQIRCHNENVVPRRGRVIVASSCVAALDGPVLYGMTPRPLHVLAPASLFIPPFDQGFRATGHIPLTPDTPDRPAMDEALRVLSTERAVGIFPETKRANGDFASIRHGIAFLQSRTNAPIVPVAIHGTMPDSGNRDDLPRLRSTIDVYFGEPFVVPPIGDIDFRATIASIGEAIRQHLADHAMSTLEVAKTNSRWEPADV